MPVVKSDVPDKLRPYQSLGVNIDYNGRGKDAYGDCPFCGREGKFSIVVETGQWRCVACNEGTDKGKPIKGGNTSVFLHKLWELSDEATQPSDYAELASERGLLYPETLISWGVVKSVLTREWLVPGYNAEGKLCQLYKYVKSRDRKVLIPMPTLGHHLFGMANYDPAKSILYLTEGIWDGSTLWEVLGKMKLSGDKYSSTSSYEASLLADANVLSIPGNLTFFESWLPLFAGKRVRLMCQSDHPKLICQKCSKSYSKVDNEKCPKCEVEGNREVEPASYLGMNRIVQILSESNSPPESIELLMWGPDGYDHFKPSGYDLRDELKRSGTALASRITASEGLIGRLCLVSSKGLGSSENTTEKSKGGKGNQGSLQLLKCEDYRTLTSSWRKAIKWTEGLDYVLSVMLASVVSTKSVGDQLWIKILGPASSGKTTLAEALATAKNYVVIRDTIRGFTSGYITPDGHTVDLLSEINGMTMITTDGDTLLQSPNLANILAEGRRLYDGSMSSHFKNGAGKKTEGHRMTWLLCGTSSLRSIDSSELGERFLDCVIMEGIDDDLEDEILWRVANRADHNLSIESDGRPESYQAPEMTNVMQLTGGYVTYLRNNAQDLISQIDMEDIVKRKCTRLGKFVAYMRARPSRRQEETAERELAARIVSQHIRLSKCLAAVLNCSTVDDEVMKRTGRVALDTARGQTLEIARHLHAAENGLEIKAIALYTHRTEDKTRTMMRFLRQIGVAETFQLEIREGVFGRPRWRLTDKLKKLWEEVHNEEG